MEVLVNGDPHSVEQACTLHQLISKLQIEGKFAVEVNQNIIPRSEYPETQLHTGDKIEIVEAIGGG